MMDDRDLAEITRRMDSLQESLERIEDSMAAMVRAIQYLRDAVVVTHDTLISRDTLIQEG